MTVTDVVLVLAIWLGLFSLVAIGLLWAGGALADRWARRRGREPETYAEAFARLGAAFEELLRTVNREVARDVNRVAAKLGRRRR